MRRLRKRVRARMAAAGKGKMGIMSVALLAAGISAVDSAADFEVIPIHKEIFAEPVESFSFPSVDNCFFFPYHTKYSS